MPRDQSGRKMGITERSATLAFEGDRNAWEGGHQAVGEVLRNRPANLSITHNSSAQREP